jgi:hypothetical protein
MANANVSIDRLVGCGSPGQGGKVIPAYVPTGTTATVLLNQLGTAAVLNVGGSQLFSASATPPSFGVNYDGFMFKLRIVGKVTTGASCNVTVAIQLGNSTVVAGTMLATTGALAVNTASANFFLEANCLWDSVSGKIQGLILPSQVNNTAVAAAALGAVTASSQSLLQFSPVVTCSAITGVTLTITEFVAETV